MFGTDKTTGRERPASKRHRWLSWLADAIDAYASYRVQRAVPEFELRRAEREIRRYRRKMR